MINILKRVLGVILIVVPATSIIALMYSNYGGWTHMFIFLILVVVVAAGLTGLVWLAFWLLTS